MATTIRNVESIISPRSPHFVGDGFRVHNFIPSNHLLDMKRMNPFVLLDYNSKFFFAPSESPRGVGVHPHRGFETVTIAYKGSVQHHDSSGGGGIIYEGDVQWMTAASGILHKEYHEKEWSKKGGEFQMVQLWVNLPAKDKMSTPKYQSIENKDFKRVKIGENGGFMEIIAGEFENIKGAASTFTPLNLYNLKMKQGDSVQLNFPKNYNTALLLIEGNIEVNGQEKVPTDHLALMENDGENFSIVASGDAVVLVMSGEPINEPIFSHGPFVMNTKQEILQAYDDFHNGKFGYLED